MTVSSTRGAAGNAAALFPVLHGPSVQPEAVGEFLAAQLQTLAERQDAFGGRVVDDAARQVRFAPHAGKHLAQGFLDLGSRLAAFRRHVRFP